jgi:hypothetical protein
MVCISEQLLKHDADSAAMVSHIRDRFASAREWNIITTGLILLPHGLGYLWSLRSNHTYGKRLLTGAETGLQMTGMPCLNPVSVIIKFWGASWPAYVSGAFLLPQVGWKTIRDSTKRFIKMAFESFRLKLVNRLVRSADTIGIDKYQTRN